MKQFIHNDWWGILKAEFQKPYYLKLREFLVNQYNHYQIYPNMNHIYQALEWTPFNKVKVVILGQDPYHGPKQAIGLSFSVSPNAALPPSLMNIYQELENDLGYPKVSHGYLKSWADQGVLLLNSILTVQAGKAFSHKDHGWEQLTDEIIKKLSERKKPVVFILWGKAAQSKQRLIDKHNNVIIASPHPSPLSAYRGFFGSRPFSRTNKALEHYGEEPINWQLPARVAVK